MQFEAQRLEGLFLLQPTVHYDQRGYFVETYRQEHWLHGGPTAHFVQENESHSSMGTVRGLHYQLPPHAQAKLVRVAYGTIWDVAVDVRPGSPTFGQWQGFVLSSSNQRQLFIAKGFAHGFVVVSHEAVVAYKCDAPHCAEAERGIHFRDPTLDIPWEDHAQPKCLSPKDAHWPPLDRTPAATGAWPLPCAR